MTILYSFRRCPYAIRARMALHYSKTSFELREVDFKHKPPELLAISPKGTVPVLVLPSGRVLEESMDIIYWALEESDPEKWCVREKEAMIAKWVETNDHEFKPNLDKYKYAVRYPEEPVIAYRNRVEIFLKTLEIALAKNQYLCGPQISLADLAIFPFVRQCAFVDKNWFDQAPYPHLQTWLEAWLKHPLFLAVMEKHPVWQSTQMAEANKVELY